MESAATSILLTREAPDDFSLRVKEVHSHKLRIEPASSR